MRAAVLLLFAQFAAALSLTAANQWFLGPLALAPVLLLEPAAFRILTRWKLLAFLLFMLAGFPLLLGTRSATLAGIPYSPEYVEISVLMGHRSVIILLALRTFTTRVSLEALADRVRRTRFRRFGEAFGLSMQLLPPVRQAAAESYREYRDRLTARNAVGHTLGWTTELLARVVVHAETHQRRTNEEDSS